MEWYRAAEKSDRFKEGAEGIIAASSIANLKLWPTSLVHEKDFGDDKVDTLVKTFGQVLSSSALDVSKVDQAQESSLHKLSHSEEAVVGGSQPVIWDTVPQCIGTH